MTNSYPTRRSAGLLDSGPVDVKGRRVDREAAVGRFRLDPCFIADQRLRPIGLRGARRDARRQQVRAAGAEALGDPRIDVDGVGDLVTGRSRPAAEICRRGRFMWRGGAPAELGTVTHSTYALYDQHTSQP